MARFESRFTETLSSPASPERALAFLRDPEARIRATEELERCERVDERSVRFFLKTERHGPVEFNGRYLLRWSREGDTVRWSTVHEPGSNITVSGQARITPDGRGGSRIDWDEQVATELPINRIVAKAVGPVASRLMARGIRGAVERMLAGVVTAPSP